MNPYYSIAELARLLDDDDARVADALVACGVPLIYKGKPADLSRWERIQPRKFNSDGAEVIYVKTGGSDPFPSPEAVVVSADALPESWTIRLKGLLGNGAQDGNEVVKISPCRWPWGNYETDLLRNLAAAAERFWRLYDPTDNTTAPTNQQVTDWLKQQGVAVRTAEIMATILRADGLPTGPRK